MKGTSSRYLTRAEAKTSADKHRRREDRQAVHEALAAMHEDYLDELEEEARQAFVDYLEDFNDFEPAEAA